MALIIRQRVDGKKGMPGFFPIFNTAVVNFNIPVTMLFNSNCCFIGKYSPIAHSIQNQEIFFIIAGPADSLINTAPRNTDGAGNRSMTKDDLIQRIDQYEIDTAGLAIAQHLFKLFRCDDIESFETWCRNSDRNQNQYKQYMNPSFHINTLSRLSRDGFLLKPFNR